MKFLVTRPLPAGAATAERLRSQGHDVSLVPLLATEPVAWQAPCEPPSALMLTSAVAAQLADATAYHALPLFAVGTATANAAAKAGFRDVRSVGDTAQALLEYIVASGFGDVLHLAGEDRTPVIVPPALQLVTRTVYRARLLPLAEMPTQDWVLLYSSRTAAHFGREIDRLGVRRADIGVAVISVAARDAVGLGWRAVCTAANPDEAALLAAVGIPCQ